MIVINSGRVKEKAFEALRRDRPFLQGRGGKAGAPAHYVRHSGLRLYILASMFWPPPHLSHLRPNGSENKKPLAEPMEMNLLKCKFVSFNLEEPLLKATFWVSNCEPMDQDNASVDQVPGSGCQCVTHGLGWTDLKSDWHASWW